MVSSAWARVSALTGTPSTSNRSAAAPSPGMADQLTGVLHATSGLPLALDPVIGDRQACLQTDRRFPSQHRTQAGVIGVAAADTLRARYVPHGDVDPGNRGDHGGQLIDCYHAVLSEIERLVII